MCVCGVFRILNPTSGAFSIGDSDSGLGQRRQEVLDFLKSERYVELITGGTVAPRQVAPGDGIEVLTTSLFKMITTTIECVQDSVGGDSCSPVTPKGNQPGKVSSGTPEVHSHCQTEWVNIIKTLSV